VIHKPYRWRLRSRADQERRRGDKKIETPGSLSNNQNMIKYKIPAEDRGGFAVSR